MNDLQKIEFEMLSCVVDICNKLNITYYLVCGSVLGAVKYRGFIPWDDDIDIGMPREDYFRFQKEAPSLLPKEYFLQNHKTDPAYPFIFSKLRNSQTTYIETCLAKLNINHGVYIDVFPIDGYPDNKADIRRLEKKKTTVGRVKSIYYDFPRFSSKYMFGLIGFRSNIMYLMHKWFGAFKNLAKYIDDLEAELSKYSCFNSKIWCNHGNWQGKLEYAPKEQYGKGTYTNFEGLQVRIPEKFDEYLKQKYGDWRAELPKDKQVSHHQFTVLDLNKSYINYRNEM